VRAPPNFIVLGPSGSGKTVTVRKALADAGVPSAYVVGESSAYGTLVALHTMLVVQDCEERYEGDLQEDRLQPLEQGLRCKADGPYVESITRLTK